MSKSDFGNCLAAFAILGFFIIFPPLIWHLKSKNTAASFLIICLGFVNLETFIGALIWSDDSQWDGKIYCDIVTRLDIFASLGRYCALTAISLNLMMVLRGNQLFLTNNTRKKWINLGICTILPTIVTGLDFVVEMFRYGIVKYRGCLAVRHSSWPSIVIFSMWPFVLSLIIMFMSATTLYTYYFKYQDINEMLRLSNTGLTKLRYVRLLIFSVIMIICMVPLSIYTFIYNVIDYSQSQNFQWEDAHNKYWKYIPVMYLGTKATYSQWINIGMSFITFIIFGLGTDATKMYISFFRKLPIIKNWIIKYQNEKTLQFEQQLAHISMSKSCPNAASTAVCTDITSKEFNNGVIQFHTNDRESSSTDIDLENQIDNSSSNISIEYRYELVCNDSMK